MEQVAAVVIPQIVSMAADPQWRVRLAIVEQLPAIAEGIGASQFDAKLLGATLVRSPSLPPPGLGFLASPQLEGGPGTNPKGPRVFGG
jgi:hypothetical protein